MGKVTLNSLVSSESPIYSQPTSIGMRFTKTLPKHPLEGVDLQNLPFDPAIEAIKSSVNPTESQD